ncbi:hypothetical protein LSTR_LSTR011337 [Laodelphax striatellus]|uniref:EF-hand domain-containing protein n=1 Tax=Laodelphax striatellus TaxID=195883 RepID=A0A482XT92_LAOST|nr:hypothetical protein LSTR_LSTR011337 [Laodelphax striatellus]
MENTLLERKDSRTSTASKSNSEKKVNFCSKNDETGCSSDQDSSKKSSVDLSRHGSSRSRCSSHNGSVSPKVPRKFITTWRHACDRTKDRTKDFLKKWRTLPEGGSTTDMLDVEPDEKSTPATDTGWSVHVWTTWVSRCPSQEDESFQEGSMGEGATHLTRVQKDKLRHFFSNVFDIDKDDLISTQDFDSFSERLKHFADWTDNSSEFSTLQQVQQGFVDDFILTRNADKEIFNTRLEKEVVTIEEWLDVWGNLLLDARNVHDLPVWLQYLPKSIFRAINKTGSGTISREELSSFYSSVLGMGTHRVEEIIDEVYNAMTANGDHPLTYSIYRLCFANFLLGRHPNGCGQYIFGFVAKRVDCFPVDYSAMNTPTEELEQYSPGNKSNRHSVVV